MDPLLAKKLMESPDFRDFANFISSEIKRLDSISNLPNSDLLGLQEVNDIAVELKARQRATFILREILSPLTLTEIYKGKPVSPDEYVA